MVIVKTSIMTGCACGLLHSGWMALTATSPAVIDTASAFFGSGLWMRQIEACLIPIGSIMA
jgi:hypothetical protein